MMRQIRILILDESNLLVKTEEAQLREAGAVAEFRVVRQEKEFRSSLNDFRPHLILSEYSLPGLTCFDALNIASEHATSPPLIVVTDSSNGERTAEIMKAGAADYVSRGHLDRLFPAIQSAVEKQEERTRRRKAEADLRERDEMLHLITDNVSDLVALVDLNGRRLYNSPSYAPILGDPENLRGSDSFMEIH